jgi:hypothetical protein
MAMLWLCEMWATTKLVSSTTPSPSIVTSTQVDVEGFEPVAMSSASRLLAQRHVENVVFEYNTGGVVFEYSNSGVEGVG